MTAHTTPNRLSQACVLALCIAGYHHTAPAFMGSTIRWLPFGLACISALMALDLLSHMLMRLADYLQRRSASRPQLTAESLRWGSYRDIKPECTTRAAPFWGTLPSKPKKPLLIDYESNAMTIAPAGSGKGICTVIPMGFAIKTSKVFVDFKGEIACILKVPLEKRGETVRILNPAGLWATQLGETDQFNPLDIIVKSLKTAGALRNITDDLRELAAQLLPEPATGSEDQYWREGARRLICDVILLECMIEEEEATLMSIAAILENRAAIEQNFRILIGVNAKGGLLPEGPMPIEQTAWASLHAACDLDPFIALIRGRAHSWLVLLSGGDSKMFDSFMSAAQQALAPFAFGNLANAMQRSSFSLHDLKSDKVTSLFIVADASRPTVFQTYIGLMQWCVMTAMKRHPNKKKPVYFILDEVTNYKINQLESLLTWGRGYGLRLHLIFQDLTAFERTYGKTALQTLLSETEIKQFLPHQRSPKTLALISEQLLGKKNTVQIGLAQKSEGHGLSESYTQSQATLITQDAVRRSQYGILIVRQSLPVQFRPVSYAEISPWRNLAGINPFHGKPFKKPVRLKIR